MSNTKEKMDKKTYEIQIRHQLDTWELDLESLKKKVAEAGAEVMLKSEPLIKSMENHMEAARIQLEDAKNQSEDAWNDVRHKSGESWKNLKQCVNDITETWSKKND